MYEANPLAFVAQQAGGAASDGTCDILDVWGHYTLDKTFDDAIGWETQNILMLARLIAACAQERTESIGVHYRTDAAGGTEASPYHVVIGGRGDDTAARRVTIETDHLSHARRDDEQID